MYNTDKGTIFTNLVLIQRVLSENVLHNVHSDDFRIAHGKGEKVSAEAIKCSTHPPAGFHKLKLTAFLIIS